MLRANLVVFDVVRKLGRQPQLRPLVAEKLEARWSQAVATATAAGSQYPL
jgi:hypothetical protein